MIQTAFLLPFLSLCISLSWMATAKTVCERKSDFVVIYHTILWQIIQSALMLCVIAAIIIIIFKVSLLAALCYLGIGFGTIFVSQFTVSLILVLIFGYEYIGAILPPLCAIASAVWMFLQINSL